MSILDITVVNVALPTFQVVFGEPGDPLPYSTVAWTVTAYTLALATVIPMTGWAADRFGTKRLYMTALLLFTLGSVLCAMATSIGMLIGFRALQGLGGGMLMPLGMTIMTRAAGPARMGRLMAILGVPMLLGPIFGPILGGYLIDNYSWHWIFLINVPIGAAAIIYSWRVLAADRPQPSESFDWIGMALMSPGLALFLYGISSIPGEGTIFSPKVIIPGIIGLLMVGGLRVLELQARAPAARPAAVQEPQPDGLDHHDVPVRRRRSSAACSSCRPTSSRCAARPRWQAGWLMAVQGLGAMCTMPIAGALSDKLPVGRIVPFGLVAIIGGMYALTQLTATTSYAYILPVLFVMGLGMGATMMPLMTSALKTLKSHDVARGSTLLNISQQIASSIGVAIMSVVLTNGLKQRPAGQRRPGVRRGRARASSTRRSSSTLAGKFPAVGEILARYADNLGAFQDALLLAVREAMASAFANTFWVAAILLTLTLIPAYFLPRKHEVSHLLDDADAEDVAPTVLLH